MSDVAIDAERLKRFRRLVRSRVRGQVAQDREPIGLTMYVSAGDRPGKAAAVRIGAARTAEDVAAQAREAMLEARPSFAAIVRQLHALAPPEEGRRPGRTAGMTQTTGLVVASRSGLVETWAASFRAGVLSSWREGEFDPGVTVDLMRSAWAEIDRLERLARLAERVQMAAHVPGPGSAEIMAKANELAEGLAAYGGHPGARAPRETEREFTAYVERWLTSVSS